MLNPERYWKITIDTEESNVLAILQGTLERNVNYIHVSDKSISDQPTSKQQQQPLLLLHGESNTHDEQFASASTLDAKPQELMKSPNPNNKAFPTIIDTEIPESPPSAPISPTHSPVQHFELSPKAPTHHAASLLKKSSQQSLSTNVACLDWKSNSQPNQQQPKTRRSFHANPYRLSNNEGDLYNTGNKHNNTLYHQNGIARPQSHIKTVDEQSEGSMDSLLDEFEQNIARSVRNPSVYSRPASRLQSVTSHHNPVPTYSRGKYFHGNIDRDDEEDLNDEEVFEDARGSLDRKGMLPNGSIHGHTIRNGGANATSGYGHINGGGGSVHDRGLHSARSRKSSRSDLYTNESGWMEPNIEQSAYQKTAVRGTSAGAGSTNLSSRLPKSRSNYSVSSSVSNGYNLGNIYRSVIGQLRRDSYYSQYQNQPQQSQQSQHMPLQQLIRNGYYDTNNLDSRSTTKSMSRLPTVHRQLDISRRRQSTYFGSNANTQSINGSVSGSVRNNNNVGTSAGGGSRNVNVKLNSNEIYQLLSTKEEPKRTNSTDAKPISRSTSFTSRLFGW